MADSESVQQETAFCDQMQSSLFKLPPELREQIYSELFITTEPITDPKLSRDEGHGMRYCEGYTEITIAGICLVRTCQRIYHETMAMVYTTNCFRFTRCCRLAAFLENLPPARVQQIRHISCDFRGSVAFFLPGAEVAGWIRYLSPATRTHHPSSCRACGRLPQASLQDQIKQLDSLTLDFAEPYHIANAVDWTGFGPEQRDLVDALQFVAKLKPMQTDDQGVEWIANLKEVRLVAVNSRNDRVVIRMEARHSALSTWAKDKLEQLKRDGVTWRFLDNIDKYAEVLSLEKAEMSKKSQEAIEKLQAEAERQPLVEMFPFRSIELPET